MKKLMLISLLISTYLYPTHFITQNNEQFRAQYKHYFESPELASFNDFYKEVYIAFIAGEVPCPFQGYSWQEAEPIMAALVKKFEAIPADLFVQTTTKDTWRQNLPAFTDAELKFVQAVVAALDTEYNRMRALACEAFLALIFFDECERQQCMPQGCGFLSEMGCKQLRMHKIMTGLCLMQETDSFPESMRDKLQNTFLLVFFTYLLAVRPYEDELMRKHAGNPQLIEHMNLMRNNTQHILEVTPERFSQAAG